ncbi:hypothetical protein [Brevibacterium album]|uniref:hypothetical protein n=1 Tax=Brevibacterium album TaxID=417948 RepID=UPI0004222413|nr:hypothetical protein [Brevibacterium album]
MTPLEYAGEIAAGLESGQVWIDPEAEYLVPQAAREELEAKAAAVDWPVYAIVTGRDQRDLDLATLVHGQLGAEEGVYLIVEPGSSFVTSKVELDDAELSREVHQRIEAGDRGSGTGNEGVSRLQGVLDSLADEDFEVTEHSTGLEHAPAPAPRTEYVGLGTDLVYALVMVPLVLAVAIAVAFGVRRRRRKPVPRYELPASLLRSASRVRREEMRRELSADSLDIARRLSELDTVSLAPELSARVTHGLDAYALAGRIVDDPAASRADLSGALVLLRTAAHDIAEVEATGGRRALGSGRRRAEDPARLCVVDPGHGRSASVADAPVEGHRGARIPVCADCAADLRAGREPAWLLEDGVPYVQGDSVWARTLFGAVGGDLVELIGTDRGEQAR